MNYSFKSKTFFYEQDLKCVGIASWIGVVGDVIYSPIQFLKQLVMPKQLGTTQGNFSNFTAIHKSVKSIEVLPLLIDHQVVSFECEVWELIAFFFTLVLIINFANFGFSQLYSVIDYLLSLGMCG